MQDLAYIGLVVVIVGGVILLIDHHCRRKADRVWKQAQAERQERDQYKWGV